MPPMDSTLPKSPDSDPLRDRFGRLCDKHGEDARQFARLKLGAALRRRIDSEDVRQEALLEAWRVYEARPELHALKGDGFRGLYRGIVPELLKVTPMVSITFCVYEFTYDWLNS